MSASKKPKLVRDSFTIPKTEYAAIDALVDPTTSFIGRDTDADGLDDATKAHAERPLVGDTGSTGEKQ